MNDISSTKASKTINILLWIAQFLLGAIFLMAGVMKSFMPIEQLVTTMTWVKDAGPLVRIVGVSEILGGLGVLFPSLLRIKPILTPIAASGLALIMFIAIIFHIDRGEVETIGMNIVLGGLAALVAWGRFKKAPVKSRFIGWK